MIPNLDQYRKQYASHAYLVHELEEVQALVEVCHLAAKFNDDNSSTAIVLMQASNRLFQLVETVKEEADALEAVAYPAEDAIEAFKTFMAERGTQK